MRWGALGPATIAVAAACQGEAFFVCNDDGDCGGGEAICEAVGACSFPDPECTSGRRFGDASQPSIAGECTNIDEGTSSATETTTSSTTISLTSDTSGDSTESGVEASTSTSGSACAPDWWDCAWARRARIGFVDVPDPALAEVPVLVLLGPPRIDYADLQADGEDLRFVSAAGEPLPYEIEAWVPDGVSVVWVSVDEISSASDHFYVYLDNPVAENAQDPGALWSPPHRAVWHMTEGTPDSTAFGNHATEVGNVAAVEGEIGDAAELGTNASRLDVAASKSLADVFVGGATITAWVRPEGWGGGGFGRIVHRDPGTGVGFQFYVGATGELRFNHHAASLNPTWNTGDVVPLLRWSHVGVMYQAGSGVPARFFVDGVEQVPVDAVMPPIDFAESDALVPIVLGNRNSNDRWFDGRLDEIRIEHTLRSDAWMRVQHLSGRDELLVFDAVEQQGGVP